MKSALSVLSEEARRRGTTYGKLVASLSERELAEIVSRSKNRERRESGGQGEKIQNLQGADDGG